MNSSNMMKGLNTAHFRIVLPLVVLLLWTGCSRNMPVGGLENVGGNSGAGIRFELSGTDNVYENLSGAEGETSVEPTSVSPLPEGSKVRILAFRRAVGGVQPDLSKDEYMGEAVYVVQSGELVPETEGLSLPLESTFDFYALTPGDLTTGGQATGYTVSVDHGTDFASSVTQDQLVEFDKTIILEPLVRRCTKLTAVTWLGYDNMQGGFTVESLELSELTDGPQFFPLADYLTLDNLSQTGARTFGNAFTNLAVADPQKPNAQESWDIVLPRKAGPFTLTLTLTFEGQTNATRLTVRTGENTPELKPGYHYHLNIKLQGAHAELWLTVVPWEDQAMTVPELGAGTRLDLEILAWEEVVIDGTNPGDPGYIGPGQ